MHARQRGKKRNMKKTQRGTAAYSQTQTSRESSDSFFLTQKYRVVKTFFSCYESNNYLALRRRKAIKEKTRFPLSEPIIFLLLTLHTQTLRCKRKTCECLLAARKTLLRGVAKHQSLQVYADVDTLNILWEWHVWGQRLLVL